MSHPLHHISDSVVFLNNISWNIFRRYGFKHFDIILSPQIFMLIPTLVGGMVEPSSSASIAYQISRPRESSIFKTQLKMLIPDLCKVVKECASLSLSLHCLHTRVSIPVQGRCGPCRPQLLAPGNSCSKKNLGRHITIHVLQVIPPLLIDYWWIRCYWRQWHQRLIRCCILWLRNT